MAAFGALYFLGLASAVVGGLHYCYECSSKSALCRDKVYDGNYLSKTLCTTACFLRYEAGTIYRGCFDGWRGGLVNSDYDGCALQNYLGEKVEWCFCHGQGKEPCNGASRSIIMMQSRQELEPTPSISPEDSGTPQPRNAYDYIQEMNDYIRDEPTSQAETGPQFTDDEIATAENLKYEDPPRGFLPASATTPVTTMTDAGYDYDWNPCGGRHDGTYADDRDCTRYFHCSNGYPYHMTCSAGTVWNDKLKGCSFTYHSDVRCELPPYLKGIVQATYKPTLVVGEEGVDRPISDSKTHVEDAELHEHSKLEQPNNQPAGYTQSKEGPIGLMPEQDVDTIEPVQELSVRALGKKAPSEKNIDEPHGPRVGFIRGHNYANFFHSYGRHGYIPSYFPYRTAQPYLSGHIPGDRGSTSYHRYNHGNTAEKNVKEKHLFPSRFLHSKQEHNNEHS